MAELRRDPITGRWVIIDTENAKCLADFDIEPIVPSGKTCPFCPGNEHMTPPEIDAHREGPIVKNGPGWLTRIIPNKFPALKIEGNLDRLGIGIYDMMNGIGAHEVIIETPDHSKTMADLLDHEVERVIWAYRNRSVDLRGDKRFKYILIFKNHGEPAGASLEHSHSQLIALPIVPKTVLEELHGSQRYFEYKERCVFCDILSQEVEDDERLIIENKNFLAFSPFVPRFPFEVWIMPKNHISDFTHIQKDEVIDLARILREMLLRIKILLKNPSYNFLIHTAPINGGAEKEDYHWHIEIMPRLTRLAGFEWGSGFYINPISPDATAKCLREVKI